MRIRIRIQAGPKAHKSEENSSFEVLNVFFLGMKASPGAWTSFMEAQEQLNYNFDQKFNFSSAVFLYQFLVIKTLDLNPDPH
jgi:hypothetical protein